MRRFSVIVMSCLMFLFFSANLIAATYSIEAEGLPDLSEIESLKIFFDVGDDFTYITDSLVLGSDIPENQAEDTLYPWTFVDDNPTVSSSTFIVEIYNSDVYDFTEIAGFADGVYNENNLVNGVLATFDFTGTITFNSCKANNSEGLSISYDLIANENANGVTFSTSAIPIPSAIMLLGGGLLGLIGIRRKIKK